LRLPTSGRHAVGPSSRKNPTGHVPGWKKILNTLAVTYGERIETAIK
jgi:hypothetical protein